MTGLLATAKTFAAFSKMPARLVSGGEITPMRAVNSKALPWLGTLWTAMSPPMRCTSLRAMDRPRPVPP